MSRKIIPEFRFFLPVKARFLALDIPVAFAVKLQEHAGLIKPVPDSLADVPHELHGTEVGYKDCRQHVSVTLVKDVIQKLSLPVFLRVSLAPSDFVKDQHGKVAQLIEQGNDHFEDAFLLINAVSKRAVNSFAPGSNEVLKLSDYQDSKESMEKLVMDERHRELMFEGKRWYDLLRVARRTGDTKELAKTVTKKQLTNISGIQIRLADPNALYLP